MRGAAERIIQDEIGPAQEQVSLEAAQQLVEALRGGDIRNAVNAPGFDKALPPILQPYVELATRMGIILSQITAGAITRVEVGYHGAIAEQNVTPITAHLLGGDLLLEWREDTGHVFMTGPATELFSGEWRVQTTDEHR